MAGPIKVIVHGALGRMGSEVLGALSRDPGVEPVGGVDLKAKEEYLSLPDGSRQIPLSKDLEGLLTRCPAQVVVDFSHAQATMPAARIAARRGVNLVIGTSGVSQENLKEIATLCVQHNVGAVVAPNFAIGAVLMIYLAKIAAPFFEGAEIIEMHHAGKVDAPSGTAIATARAMAERRGKPFPRAVPTLEPVKGSRDSQIEGVTLHALRLPGLLAHQEVVLGTLGQTLSIRHDTISRECYIPGILLAIKEVVSRKGLTYGLENLLNLQEVSWRG